MVPEGNAAAHVQDTEARPQKRAFTLEELQDFSADEHVTRLGIEAARAGVDTAVVQHHLHPTSR